MTEISGHNETFNGTNETNQTSHYHIVVMSLMSKMLSDPFVKRWFGWFLTPVVVAFMLPIAILLFIWSSSLILYIHRVHKRRLVRRLREAIDERDIVKAGREIVAALWDAQVRHLFTRVKCLHSVLLSLTGLVLAWL